jgi:uncharacterized protein YbbK (DUF523 family)
MQKILISSCLLGAKVRYNAEGKMINHPLMKQWFQEGRLVMICPEMAGGLPTPRPPAERIGDKVMANTGIDVTAQFQKGAEAALALCQKHGIRVALLKANSPSCGNMQIYDGSFSGKKIAGQGVTAALLMAHGIRVFNEDQLEELALFVNHI